MSTVKTAAVDKIRGNPPVTAAGVAAAVGLVLAAFTDFTVDQIAAVNAVVVIVAAFAGTRYTRSMFATVDNPDGSLLELHEAIEIDELADADPDGI
jgi:hypothetical protein